MTAAERDAKIAAYRGARGFRTAGIVLVSVGGTFLPLGIAMLVDASNTRATGRDVLGSQASTTLGSILVAIGGVRSMSSASGRWLAVRFPEGTLSRFRSASRGQAPTSRLDIRVSGGEYTMIKASIRNVASRILHHYPLYGGCRWIANSMPFLWLSEPMEVVATVRTGGKLMVRVDDFDGRTAFYFGDHDPRITWVARQVVRRGDTVLDVGANWGIATTIFADLTGPGGCVHAFEPQSFLAESLARSVRLNGYPHVHVHPVGLSTEDAEVVMRVPKNHCGAGSVEAPPPWASPSGVDHVRVELVGADAYLERLRLSKVRLMKIDVEGHEASVLSGAIRFFERTPPDVVIFEHTEGSAGFWAHPVVRHFAERGYALGVIPLSAKGKGAPWLRSIQPPACVPGHDVVAIGPCEDRGALMSALGMSRH